ncbi:MAG TPA: SDR family NAD(P)-dependent oxidoreductase [Steroidobacteraceae bacterium]
MNLNLKNKTALVTGSSTGIGAAIAKTLAAEGARVIVHGRDKARTQQVASEITQSGGDAHAIAADVPVDAGAARLIAQASEYAGGIDVLVNNAGVYFNRGWEAASSDWNDIYNVNVASVVRLIQGFLPSMRQRRWGRIIQISSGEALAPMSRMPDYAVTKAALANMTVSLAQELSGTGITVNTLSPGIIVTEEVKRFFTQTAKEKGWDGDWNAIEQKVLAEILPNSVGRLGMPEDVAPLVAYVASPLASFINGANVRVDGGSCRFVN